MVRFKADPMQKFKQTSLVSIPIWFDLKSTTREIAIITAVVSIPIWFDLK